MTERNRQGPSAKTPILFTRTVAAQLARVSLDFLERLEQGDLIRPRELEGGEKGYAPEDIGRLSRIRIARILRGDRRPFARRRALGLRGERQHLARRRALGFWDERRRFARRLALG